jgi:muconolactone delta-isomerase
MSGVITTNDAVLDEMLGKLGALLSPIVAPGPPPPPQPPPAPTLALVSVSEHSVGIGNRRGTGMLGSFKVRALKGLQLDAVVRFQYWAETQEEAEASVAGLQGRVRNAANELRAEGFLRVEAATTSVAESVATVNDFWRKSADYRVLYEFQYEDNDGAEGLVARIPIDFEGEFSESTVVTDDMVRWDEVAAPTIVVRGSGTRARRVNALTVVAFLPAGWDGTGFVTVRASIGGDVQEQVFPHVRAFVEAFEAETDTVTLGANPYLVGRLSIEQVGFPLVLPFTLKRDDFLLISYSNTEFDSDAVVYLRVV